MTTLPQQHFPRARLLVFAKAPVPGRVKTRLRPALSPQAAADLHTRLVEHTLRTACGAGLCPVELWCAPDTTDPFFAHCARTFPVALHVQPDGDLGVRMAAAFDHVLRRHPYAILVGTDCPSLTAADLERALQCLHDGADVVLGPAEDGGYVLIGLRRRIPELFTGVDWGTDRVLEQTRTRLRALGCRWGELPVRWDVDRPADLDRLRKEQLWEVLYPAQNGDTRP